MSFLSVAGALLGVTSPACSPTHVARLFVFARSLLRIWAPGQRREAMYLRKFPIACNIKAQSRARENKRRAKLPEAWAI
jgi:hypothetical protein